MKNHIGRREMSCVISIEGQIIVLPKNMNESCEYLSFES